MLAFGQAGSGAGRSNGSIDHFGVALSLDDFLSNDHFAADRAVLAFGQAGSSTGCIDSRVDHFGVTLSCDHGAGLDGYATFTDGVAGVAVGGAGGIRGVFGVVVASVLAAGLGTFDGFNIRVANIAADGALGFVYGLGHAIASGDQVTLFEFAFVPLANGGGIDGFGVGCLCSDIRTAGVEVKGVGGNRVGIGIGATVDLAAFHSAKISVCIKVLGIELVDGSTGAGPYSFIQSTYFLCMTRQAKLSGKYIILAGGVVGYTVHNHRTGAIGLHDAAEVSTGSDLQGAIYDEVRHHTTGSNTIQGRNLAQGAVNRIVGRGCSAVIIGFCIIYFRVRWLVKNAAFLALRACTVVIGTGEHRQLYTFGDCQFRIGIDLQACTGQQGHVKLQFILTVFQNDIIVVRHREIPAIQRKCIAGHLQLNGALDCAATDLNGQLANVGVKGAGLAAVIGGNQGCAGLQGNQAAVLVIANENYGAAIVFTVLILIGITVHGVAALHFQSALDGLGGVAGRGIQASVSILGICYHTAAHAAAGIGITPAPAGLSMQRQGLINLGTGAVGDHRACTVNIADS